MLKIKDESGKTLYNVSDEATEPTPVVLEPPAPKEPDEEDEKKE